jgi:hypothetical protein
VSGALVDESASGASPAAAVCDSIALRATLRHVARTVAHQLVRPLAHQTNGFDTLSEFYRLRDKLKLNQA